MILNCSCGSTSGKYGCPLHGTHTPTSVGGSTTTFTPHQTFPSLMPVQYGWVCPRCSAVMAPFVNACVNCRGNSVTITSAYIPTNPGSISSGTLVGGGDTTFIGAGGTTVSVNPVTQTLPNLPRMY